LNLFLVIQFEAISKEKIQIPDVREEPQLDKERLNEVFFRVLDDVLYNS